MQAPTVTMLLFFSGMIAFVPVPQSNYVEALLLKIEHHEQILVLPLNKLKNEADCEGLCSREGHLCVCRLRKEEEVDPSEITTITIGSSPGPYSLPREPPKELTEANMYDIDWLVSMEHVKRRSARINRRRVSDNVGTQMQFGWAQAATCQFEEAKCAVQGKMRRRVFDVEFDDWLNSPDVSQPVAELVVFQATAGPSIEIHFKNKVDKHTKKLDLEIDEGPYPVLISNSTKSEHNAKELCEQCEEDFGQSDHFRSFERLSGPGLGVPIHRQCGADDYKDLPQKPFPICDAADIFGVNSDFMADKALRARFPWATLGDRIICPPAALAN
jgi:hypothetical protein